ncbi:bifunctional folylpolyglutamate synthase/dihydrofolate synthase [Nigerium massiliense]|uniref:bifunctional folylpolyglutamate synthase/dihydrofolate synthase n=1 Tax=Nigerium massiliense TaxID=1522317 RepID=UPI00058C5B99|nr:folylpolyglutamate synthase/dihydrofolate synthase family protein [Nigerium massiliense]
MSDSAHDRIVAELQARWPEHRVGPSTARVEALCDLMGDPQRAYPVIQVAGTNGKGTTAIMIEKILLAMGLRVGRYCSPHLMDLTERICIDGEPIAKERFDALLGEVQPLIAMVDAQEIDGIPMTFFEVMTGLAYWAFAEAPVDVAVVEVGLGGRWDATNVADASVAVICPIDLDHTHILGSTRAEIATEKAGIIKEGSVAVVAAQAPEVAEVIVERCAEVGARIVAEGEGFALLDRQPGVGGQIVRLEGAGGPVGDLILPVFGAHMAHNAALALGAVEAFLGGKPVPADALAEGLEAVTAPARLEVVRQGPTIVLDSCHNPHGARATMDALAESFTFTPLIGVVAMMADKDVEGVLEIFAEQMQTIVCTQVASTDRGMPVDELADIAAGIVGEDRVVSAPSIADAIERAVALADADGAGAGILIAGSVVAAGEARGLLVHEHGGEAGADDLAEEDR